MVNYKELGLVNTRDMFSRAVKSGWAVPAFNFNNLEQLQAIITASSELRSFFRFQRAHVNMQTLHFSATWLKVQYSSLKNLAATTLK